MVCRFQIFTQSIGIQFAICSGHLPYPWVQCGGGGGGEWGVRRRGLGSVEQNTWERGGFEEYFKFTGWPKGDFLV